jgi:hypothetical protein
MQHAGSRPLAVTLTTTLVPTSSRLAVGENSLGLFEILIEESTRKRGSVPKLLLDWDAAREPPSATLENRACRAISNDGFLVHNPARRLHGNLDRWWGSILIRLLHCFTSWLSISEQLNRRHTLSQEVLSGRRPNPHDHMCTMQIEHGCPCILLNITKLACALTPTSHYICGTGRIYCQCYCVPAVSRCLQL